ncbi:MAG: hypothetical protein M1829_003505 [Trizodia sp. TS-e1964]|nr:MAG: hypothetical protein M1829_003505 [Trizodia sp. TS-e1964]
MHYESVIAFALLSTLALTASATPSPVESPSGLDSKGNFIGAGNVPIPGSEGLYELNRPGLLSARTLSVSDNYGLLEYNCRGNLLLVEKTISGTKSHGCLGSDGRQIPEGDTERGCGNFVVGRYEDNKKRDIFTVMSLSFWEQYADLDTLQEPFYCALWGKTDPTLRCDFPHPPVLSQMYWVEGNLWGFWGIGMYRDWEVTKNKVINVYQPVSLKSGTLQIQCSQTPA